MITYKFFDNWKSDYLRDENGEIRTAKLANEDEAKEWLAEMGEYYGMTDINNISIEIDD